MLRVCWEDAAILDLNAASFTRSSPPSPSYVAPPAMVQAPKIAYHSAKGPKAKSRHEKPKGKKKPTLFIILSLLIQ